MLRLICFVGKAQSFLESSNKDSGHHRSDYSLATHFHVAMNQYGEISPPFDKTRKKRKAPAKDVSSSPAEKKIFSSVLRRKGQMDAIRSGILSILCTVKYQIREVQLLIFLFVIKVSLGMKLVGFLSVNLTVMASGNPSRFNF